MRIDSTLILIWVDSPPTNFPFLCPLFPLFSETLLDTCWTWRKLIVGWVFGASEFNFDVTSPSLKIVALSEGKEGQNEVKCNIQVYLFCWTWRKVNLKSRHCVLGIRSCWIEFWCYLPSRSKLWHLVEEKRVNMRSSAIFMSISFPRLKIMAHCGEEEVQNDIKYDKYVYIQVSRVAKFIFDVIFTLKSKSWPLGARRRWKMALSRNATWISHIRFSGLISSNSALLSFSLQNRGTWWKTEGQNEVKCSMYVYS